ncbi:MAG: alpha/beta hydrolase [Alphaproteobacteria bacterium]|nr:alpha/beta hydrolase [Alphaproteobacteria bacterium]
MLPEKFKEPTGFQWGNFTNTQGANIRYGSLQPEGAPKGTLVIVTGLREPVEKYFEVVREMVAKGFAVWVMDWRGQGGSDRYLKDAPQKMHGAGYGEHIETLHQFAGTIVKKSAGPLILLAHSMGAHIGLRYLKEHEGVFDSAVLTAPMLDVSTGVLAKPLARKLVSFAKAGGILEKYMPGGGDWKEGRDPFQGNAKTTDPERYEVLHEIFKSKPELTMGDPTYGWVHHAFESIDILNDEAYLKAIKTPILMQISGDEAIVDKTASERAAALIPNCTRVDMPTAKHEIWMERDELRNQWLSAAGTFLEGRLKAPPPAPKKPNQNGGPLPPK